ncbi:MAG: GNAT family N-acetyltransferase [Nocardioides sp.]
MSSTVRFVPLPLDAMDALLASDLVRASELVGVELTAYILEHDWLWRIRTEQIRGNPAAAEWVARAAVVDGVVVGHAGFHGPPDENGMVEVAYSVDPAFRRRGYATAMLEAALAWAASDPAVSTVRASISPDNTASLATIKPFGFVQIGEQWDEEDGLELLFEIPVPAGH